MGAFVLVIAPPALVVRACMTKQRYINLITLNVDRDKSAVTCVEFMPKV